MRGTNHSVGPYMGKSKRRTDHSPESHERSQAPRDVGLLASAWHTLSSMRLAVTVLIIFAIASLLGAVLPQQGISGPPGDDVIRAVYLQKYGGTFGRLMLAASLHNVYRSLWYLALLFLLCLSTFACACKSTPRARRRMGLPAGDVMRQDVLRMRRHQEATSQIAVADAVARASAALRRLGYALRSGTTARQQRGKDDSGWLVGRKLRWTAWASPVLHFSLLLIVVGGVVGLLPGVGFRDRLPLVEGETYDGQTPPAVPTPGHPTEVKRAQFDFELTLRSFDMTYYPDGAVEEYASNIVVTRKGEQIAEKRVRVNHPLRVGGVNFYQSSWDLESVVVSVRAADGTEELLEFPLQPTQDHMGRRAWLVPITSSIEEALEPVPSMGWTVFCHGFWHDYTIMRGDEMIRSGDAESGDMVVNFTGFPRSPAVSLIVYPDFEGDKQRFENLGTITTHEEQSYGGHSFRLVGVKKVSILDVRKDPGVPLLYAGFAGVTLAMMVALYLAPRTVRLHISRKRGATHAAMGGAGSTGDFGREFAVLAEALEAGAPEPRAGQ